MKIAEENLTKELHPLHDDFLDNIKNNWFNNKHRYVNNIECLPMLDQWFKSSKFNDVSQLKSFPFLDITMGNTHFIESFVGKHGYDGFQILNEEYAYYSFMGKWGVELGQLEKEKPLIITIPHYKWGGIRPEWNELLQECEAKNIDIHIDMAWLTLSKNINIDFSHPCITSVGMSMSKYSLQWNRIGIRYSKQRTMDSITMFNHYYQPNTNGALSSCGAYCVENIPRDYGWNTYKTKNEFICKKLNLHTTNLIHVVHDKNKKSMGISNLLRYGEL